MRLGRPRGATRAVWQLHLYSEGPGDAGDNGDPVTASELDRVRIVVHVDVGKRDHELLHRGGVCGSSIDRFRVPRDVRDHVWMMYSSLQAYFSALTRCLTVTDR